MSSIDSMLEIVHHFILGMFKNVLCKRDVILSMTLLSSTAFLTHFLS